MHIQSVLGKGITQRSLQAALIVALSVNRKIIVRPNVFLCLASLLVAEAVLTAWQPHTLGTYYRTIRLAEFIIVLWLITPWSGRRLLLLWAHITMLGMVLGSVVLGLLVAPGTALAGRLSGVIWAIPPRRSHTTRPC